jgi:hypothetical protein
MTGHGGGNCVLRESENNPGCFEGLLGRLGRPATLKIDPTSFPVNTSCAKIKEDVDGTFNRPF